MSFGRSDKFEKRNLLPETILQEMWFTERNWLTMKDRPLIMVECKDTKHLIDKDISERWTLSRKKKKGRDGPVSAVVLLQ